MSYFKDIVYAAFLCGIITSISGLTKNGSGKYVKYVCALSFLCVIMAPFIKDTTESIDFFKDLYDITSEKSEITQEQSDNMINIIVDEICKAAADNAAETFNVSPNEFTIQLSVADDNREEIRISDVMVFVSGDAKNIPIEKIRLHFERILGRSVEIEYVS